MMDAPPTPTLNAAVRRVAEAYQRLPERARPDIEGPDWRRREDAIDDAYRDGDSEKFKGAVRAWEDYALTALRRPS